jgi:threonine synthase
VVSAGDGCTIAGIWKGLTEMYALGLLDRLPRMLGVQAAGARPLVDAFRDGKDLVPGPARTIADSICVGHPRNWRKALRAVRASGGAFVAVPDEAILDAMRETGRRAGVFGEPAGVAGLAGLRQAVANGIVGRRSSALAVVTGSGLKDTRTAIRAAGEPVTLPPDDAALDALLREHPL